VANVRITDLAAYTNPDSTDVLPIVDVGADVTKKVSIADLLTNAGSGTFDAPGIAFDGDNNTGIYRPGADQLALATNGTERVEFGTSEVVFNDGGNNYDFRIEGDTEANLLFVDASANRVGVGTSSPHEIFHVRGNTAEFKVTNTNEISDTGGTEQVFKFGIEAQKNGVYGPAGSIIFRQDGSTWSSVDANNKQTRIEFCTQDSSSTDNSETPRLVINRVGNVGIGTTSPGVALHVDGDIRCDGVYGETDTSTSIQFPGSNVITFNEGGSEAARIDSSGRLLIGTSTAQRDSSVGRFPQMQLNSSSSTQNSSTFGIYANSPSTNCSINLYRNRATTAGGFDYTGGTVQAGDVLGQIAFLGVDGQATPVMRSGASIQAVCESTPTTAEMPSRLVFSVTADDSASPTEALRISNDRSITVSDGGDVVLGTTTGTKIGTATSQKIGFYNATPVVQPTTGVAEAAFVENSGGTAVNVDSTFGGYTIQQVVKALQTLGLLA
jgi:hypothetical protein